MQNCNQLEINLVVSILNVKLGLILQRSVTSHFFIIHLCRVNCTQLGGSGSLIIILSTVLDWFIVIIILVSNYVVWRSIVCWHFVDTSINTWYQNKYDEYMTNLFFSLVFHWHKIWQSSFTFSLVVPIKWSCLVALK